MVDLVFEPRNLWSDVMLFTLSALESFLRIELNLNFVSVYTPFHSFSILVPVDIREATDIVDW